jgi:ABC-2 type transport system permease protein
MLHQIVTLAWKDLRIFFKDPGAAALIFLMPFMFMVVMSFALSGSFGSGDSPIHILAANEDLGAGATAVLGELDAIEAFSVVTEWEGEPLTQARAEALVAQGKAALALIFPPDFSQALGQARWPEERKLATVTAIVDPAAPLQLVEPALGTVQGILERSAYTAMAPQGVALPTELPVELVRTAPAEMHVEKFPDTYQQNVPGYTIFGIFWIVSLLAESVLREKREGTFRRLLVAPLKQPVMLAGKLLPYYLINLLQIAIMFGVARVLFGMGLGPTPWGLAVVSLAAAATAIGLVVLVAALVRTEAQAGGLTVVILLTLSALGGCFVPRFVMPGWMQTVGVITPHAWALDAYQDLLVRGYGLGEVLPKVGVLLGFAACFFGVGVWRFRFE